MQAAYPPSLVMQEPPDLHQTAKVRENFVLWELVDCSGDLERLTRIICMHNLINADSDLCMGC